MRALRFARIALRAEREHIRHAARRGEVRAILALLASLFLVGSLGTVQAGLFLVLETRMAPEFAMFALAGVDGVLAVVLAITAISLGESKREKESRLLAREAVSEAVSALSWVDAALLAVQLVRKAAPPKE